MMSKLYKTNNIVKVETDKNWVAIALDINGKYTFDSLLPNDYLMKNNLHKMYIFKFNSRNEVLSDLFNFYGECLIENCVLVYNENNQVQQEKITIINNDRSQWQQMNKDEETDVKMTWDSFTTNYNRILSRSHPLNTNVSMNKNVKDFDTGIISTEVVSVSTKSKTNYRNTSNKDFLGNLDTKGREFKIMGENTPYTGKYHIITKTLEVKTGEKPENGSKKLIRINGKSSRPITTGTRNGGY